MLVRFKSKAYADITMFADVAVKLLKLMGHSGAVPGAISAQEIPASLARLKAGLAAEETGAGEQTDTNFNAADQSEQPVSLKRRAWPLIELLEAAVERDEFVMWDH